MKKTNNHDTHSHDQKAEEILNEEIRVSEEEIVHEKNKDLEENGSPTEEVGEAELVEGKIRELEDLIKRQAADFDNYRKRVQEEREKFKDLSQETIILDFLPVFDNLERAFEFCREPGATLEGVKEGLEGIMALFADFLGRWEIQKVSSVGEPFDPKIHEALFMQEGDYKQKEVIQEVEKAYVRKDRVLRTAKVGVGVPSTTEK